MKAKIKLFAFIFAGLFSMAACGNKTTGTDVSTGATEQSAENTPQALQELKEAIEFANAMCPVSMGIVGDMTGVRYDSKDNMVNFYCKLDPEMADMDVMMQNFGNMDRTAKLALIASNSSELIDEMCAAGVGMQFIFSVPGSDEEVKVPITADELRELSQGEMSEKEAARTLLTMQLSQAQESCPIEIAPGMVLESVKEKDGYIVYTATLDESRYSLNSGVTVDDVKRDIAATFTDPSVAMMINEVVALDMGMKYIYKGASSGKSIEAKFTTDELRKYAD